MVDSRAARKFFIDFRLLALLSILSAVPLLIGFWWLYRSHEDALLERGGMSLAETAEMAFNSVNRYLQNQIIEIAGLTEIPNLREAVKRGNLDLDKDLERVRRAIPEMEKRWPSLPPESSELRSILNNPASDFLRRYTAVNRSYREIMVTDYLGRLVAASGKTTDYYQADEDWWKEAYGDGQRGSVYLGDVEYDASAQSQAMQLAQPFVEPGSGVLGVIKVVMDLQELHSIIGSIPAGSSASAALIHASGKIISVPGRSAIEWKNYPATLDILNARDRERRYFISSASPAAVYGLAQSSFPKLYPHLNWILVATAPVSGVIGSLAEFPKYFLMLFVGIIALNLLVTFLISRVETKPVLEQDPHLERL